MSEELIADLEAEIVKRDARIAELAREIDANCMREAREIGILKRECDRLRNELAAMRAPSRMVLPERGNENEGNSYSVMQAMARNQALDEVARLNPCRAQAVADGLTFNALRAANAERIGSSKYRKCEENWTPAHWMQATVGELGELANLLKKVDRGDFPFEQVKGDVAKELADVQTYLDILALKLGVDLGRATIDKFNEVSARIGSHVMLAAAPPASAAAVSVPKLLGWAVDRWQAEVSQRPLVNAHRRILDDTWRQVIRKLGGDPVDLCGPAHDTLLSTTNRGEPQ